MIGTFTGMELKSFYGMRMSAANLLAAEIQEYEVLYYYTLDPTLPYLMQNSSDLGHYEMQIFWNIFISIIFFPQKEWGEGP